MYLDLRNAETLNTHLFLDKQQILPMARHYGLSAAFYQAHRKTTGTNCHQQSGVPVPHEAVQRCIYRLVQTDVHASCHSCKRSSPCLHGLKNVKNSSGDSRTNRALFCCEYV